MAVDSSKHKGEYSWIIKGDVLTQMLDARNEQKFTSETFTMASLNWCMDTYPNGHKDNNIGSFKVFLKLLSLPPKGTKVIVCRRIYCQETESSYTCMTSYDKYGYWGWPDHTLSLDECKKLHQLSIMVKVKILRIINEFNGQNTITYSYVNEQNRIPKRQLYKWNINYELIDKMKNSYNGKRFESPIFDDMWCLQIAPNGATPAQKDNFVVYLQICIPKMGVQWKLICEQIQTNEDYTNLFDRNGCERCDWGNNKLSFTKFKNCPIDSLQFEVEIDILSMFDDNGVKLSATKMRKRLKQPEFKFKYLKTNTLEDKLYKRGKFNKSWKERFFIVNRTEQTIEYYSSANDRTQHNNMCGSIDLGAVCRIEVVVDADISINSLTDHPGIAYNSETKSDKQYTFHLIIQKRTYVFAAYGKESLLKWLIYLESCLYGNIIHEGWMEMANLKTKSNEFKFKFRYFTLNKFQQIRFYDMDSKHKKKYDQSCSNGTIDCKLVDRVNMYAKPPRNCKYYMFEVHTKSQSYLFGAITQIDRSDWIELINIMKAKDFKYQLEYDHEYEEKKSYDYEDYKPLGVRTYQDLIDISDGECQKNKNNNFVQERYKEYIVYAKLCIMGCKGGPQYDFDSDWLWKEYVMSDFNKQKQKEIRQYDFLSRRIIAEPNGIAGLGFTQWANEWFSKMYPCKSECLKKFSTDFDQMCKASRIRNLIDIANAKLTTYDENDKIFKQLIAFAMYCVKNLHLPDRIVPDLFLIGCERFNDINYKKKKQLFNIDKNIEEWGNIKKLLHIIHHIVAFPHSQIGKKFDAWCQKYKNDSHFDNIKNNYNQMIADNQKQSQEDEKQTRDRYNKMKAKEDKETQDELEIQSNKHDTVAKNKQGIIEKNDTSNNSRSVYPALYCSRNKCGNAIYARDCGKCGNRMLKVKIKAYLCTGCGIGAHGQKCIKCDKHIFRSVQAYLCSSKCGLPHKRKKCVKCGARVWGI